jgi:starch phosphorylase
MIRLITAVAEVINKAPTLNDRLKVVFLPDYNVTNGERVYPAADLYEPLSTAGKEASGTGSMDFSMNGALTIDTLDGANVEIREEVGADNFFLFGMTAEQVQASWMPGCGCDPMALYRGNDQPREVIDLICEGQFSRGDRKLFRPLVNSLLVRDNDRPLGGFAPYIEAQTRSARPMPTASAGRARRS